MTLGRRIAWLFVSALVVADLGFMGGLHLGLKLMDRPDNHLVPVTGIYIDQQGHIYRDGLLVDPRHEK